MNDGPSSCPRAGVVSFSALKLRRQPLDTLLGRHRLNGIFEHHVGAGSDVLITLPRTGLRTSGTPGRGQFHRILSQRFVGELAFRAFEGPQIRTVATMFDAGQHHAILTRRTAWPRDRNERWFGASKTFRHVILPQSPIAAENPAAKKPACRTALPAADQYCSPSKRISGRTRKRRSTRIWCIPTAGLQPWSPAAVAIFCAGTRILPTAGLD
jgi:hypothetical protein